MRESYKLPADYKFALVESDSCVMVDLQKVSDLSRIDGNNLIIVLINPNPLISESGTEAKFAISRSSDLSD